MSKSRQKKEKKIDECAKTGKFCNSRIFDRIYFHDFFLIFLGKEKDGKMRNAKPKQHVKHVEDNEVNAVLIIGMIKTIVADVVKTKDVEMTVVEVIAEVTVISVFHSRPLYQNSVEKRHVWIEAIVMIVVTIVIAELIVIAIEMTEMILVIVALIVDLIETEIHADEMKEETPKNLYESKR